MKRILCLILAFTFILLPTFVYAEGENISVYVNGKAVNFDVPPTTINDRTMIPLRATFEMLGASVSWDDNTQTATGVKDGISVMLTIGSNTLYRNGNAVTLDVPPMLIADRTLVPVRAISEAFGCQVDWDENTQSVLISSNSYSEYNTPSETSNSPSNVLSTTSVVKYYEEVPWCPDFGDVSGATLLTSMTPGSDKLLGRTYVYSMNSYNDGSLFTYAKILEDMGFERNSYKGDIMFLKDDYSVTLSLGDDTIFVMAATFLK